MKPPSRQVFRGAAADEFLTQRQEEWIDDCRASCQPKKEKKKKKKEGKVCVWHKKSKYLPGGGSVGLTLVLL